jgi:putative redox protein
MKAQLVRLQGITFAVKGNSNHWITIDGPEEFGGSNAGSSPKELILFGLAGCASVDVVSILQKRRINLERYEVNVEAEVAEQHPKVIKTMHLSFLFKGKNIKPKDVERAIELSRTTYCGVWATLKDSVEITYSYEIQE